MDNSETSSPEFPTISPILLHFLVPTFRLRYTSRVSDVVLKEFGFELMPFDKIGLYLVHISDLGLSGSGTRNELSAKVEIEGENNGSWGWGEDLSEDS